MSNIDFYEQRHTLKAGQVFRDREGYIVQLERGVPGDGTKWYVLDYENGSWFGDDTTVEPGDLVERLDAAEYAA